jgi:hypothetical protein
LSIYSQDQLNQQIALSLTTRPRQRHAFRSSPLQVYNEYLHLAEATLSAMH